MSRTAGGFYVGHGWFIPRYNVPVQEDYLLPYAGDDGSITDTQNVEELRVNPEDMDDFPQDIQGGANQWVTFSVPVGDFYTTAAYRSGLGQGGFYIASSPGIGGFYLQDIGI